MVTESIAITVMIAMIVRLLVAFAGDTGMKQRFIESHDLIVLLT